MTTAVKMTDNVGQTQGVLTHRLANPQLYDPGYGKPGPTPEQIEAAIESYYKFMRLPPRTSPTQ